MNRPPLIAPVSTRTAPSFVRGGISPSDCSQACVANCYAQLGNCIGTCVEGDDTCANQCQYNYDACVEKCQGSDFRAGARKAVRKGSADRRKYVMSEAYERTHRKTKGKLI